MAIAGFKITAKEFEQFRDGDEQVFESVYHAYYKTLFTKINNLCNDTELSNEVIQETFIQLFINKEKIKEPEALYPFLYTVSKRMAISAFRKSVVRMQYQEYLQYTFEESSEARGLSILDDDMTSRIHEMIDELPTEQKKVFKMNKIEEMSYKEIAESVGVSPHTVRNQIANATKLIRLKVSKMLFLSLFLLFLLSQ
ncbi:RNA polymerase sigma factor [Sphingobacterium paucimobilis]|uniref:HTH luxR-type domain-containing protein n=1 Tax=Sphingobacterium paucimobilis HER1398 TaxID=1346330 RepID=U2HGM2_9SPHI|nr:sigma-70 family RNA polymerase sigma factor [Sphingobacterium paucimobilis]ERJ60911.1 hypothetical protein M472_19330 [Sphingobacterium paucimobilis HER1398]